MVGPHSSTQNEVLPAEQKENIKRPYPPPGTPKADLAYPNTPDQRDRDTVMMYLTEDGLPRCRWFV
jgi:hypothetical protein